MMDDREVVLVKMEDPSNAVEFRDATLAWEKARPPPTNVTSCTSKLGGMKRVLRREKLRLYISTDDCKEIKDLPNAQSLLTNMEQESPQSTISSNQSIRPPLHKILHRIDVRIKRVTGQPRSSREGNLSQERGCICVCVCLSRVQWLESVVVLVVERAHFYQPC